MYGWVDHWIDWLVAWLDGWLDHLITDCNRGHLIEQTHLVTECVNLMYL